MALAAALRLAAMGCKQGSETAIKQVRVNRRGGGRICCCAASEKTTGGLFFLAPPVNRKIHFKKIAVSYMAVTGKVHA